MLAYAFQVLQQKNYEEIAAEEFDFVEDLFASILSKGVSQQLKQGLYREYISKKEELSTLKGKLNIHGSIRHKIERKRILACEYDELSTNNLFNQIIKTTILYLIHAKNVKKETKGNLKKIILFFDEIDEVAPKEIRWDALRYQRNNKSYQMLINLCYFVLEGMLQSTESGKYKMRDFSDEQMAKLYEKFVLEYYKKHHSYLSDIKAAQIKWDLGDNNDEKMIRFLPTMQTDITLRYGEETLIIDTKFYGKTMQKQFDKESLHSNNMYQIFTYVKNYDVKRTGKVSGILLYAKTGESITPDFMYEIGGNMIGAKSLDLNKDFKYISNQLDNIIKDHFSVIEEICS